MTLRSRLEDGAEVTMSRGQVAHYPVFGFSEVSLVDDEADQLTPASPSEPG